MLSVGRTRLRCEAVGLVVSVADISALTLSELVRSLEQLCEFVIGADADFECDECELLKLREDET